MILADVVVVCCHSREACLFYTVDTYIAYNRRCILEDV